MTASVHTIIIGAGLGGLTAGALLLRAGHRVTVLESQVYPGGSASTFYHQGFRFDAGATLAGGFAPGGPHTRLAEILGVDWPIQPVEPAWIVHLPDGRTITQWTDRQQWQAEWRAAFPQTAAFWSAQERLADISWDISSRPFPWPPESPGDLWTLLKALRPRTLPALPYLFRTIGSMVAAADPMFKSFLDGQLLIAAQTTTEYAQALYGSAALDLPRRGVNQVQGGIGALAQTLVDWIQAHGGEVLFRQKVAQIIVRNGQATAVITQKGQRFSGDAILANLTPWALADLLGPDAPPRLQKEVTRREPTWGAFTLYLGLDATRLPQLSAGHYQVISDHTQPLGEGNSVFISLSDAADGRRGPAGTRTATLSTHTAVAPWWQLRRANDESAYLARREHYTEKVLAAADKAIPGLAQAVTLRMAGTPVTFEFFTGRPLGMVGGFPQTSLFKARGPGTGIGNLWLVGDSIFPGQSTAGVTLGGMRVATAVLQATSSAKPWTTAPTPAAD